MNAVNYYGESFDELDTNLNCNSVPILCWDFHYESINELKIFSSDIKKSNKLRVNLNGMKEV